MTCNTVFPSYPAPHLTLLDFTMDKTSGRLLAQTCIQSFLFDTLPFACGASIAHIQEKKFIVAGLRYLVDCRPLWLENDGVDTHAMSLLLYIILLIIKLHFFFTPSSIKQSMNIKVSSLNVFLSSAAGLAPPVTQLFPGEELCRYFPVVLIL